MGRRALRGCMALALGLGAPLVAFGCSLAIPFDSLTGGDGSTPTPDGPGSDGDAGVLPDADGGNGCRSDCLGAACVDGRCVPIDVISGQGEPQGLSVDDSQVFWTNKNPVGLYRLPLAGSSSRSRIDEVVDGIQIPWDIAVDATHYYWSEYKQNVVFRKPRAGGAKQQVSSCTGQCAWMVVASNQVFATDYFVTSPQTGSVSAAPAAGGNSVNLYPNQPLAAGLAVSNGVLFWVRGGEAGSIQAGSLAADGGPPSGAAGIGVAVTGLAADGDDLYFIAEERRLQHLRRGETTAETLYEAAAPFGPGDVAVTPEAVYWTEPKTGLLRKTSR